MTRMGPSEALVEALRVEGTSVITGLVGSAFMDALDIFPKADIRFVPVRHEQTAVHMADAYARILGKPGVCTGQNGPGVTNMVTGMAVAHLAHSPVILLSPSASSKTVGTDGFQEADQMSIFSKITRYQVQVNRPDRIPEYVRNAFRIALAESGPVQIDIPRDHLYGEVDVEILPPERYREVRRGAGAESSLKRAAELLAEAKLPVIISGQGVVLADGVEETRQLAEYLSAPVVTSYLHNDAFPADHRLAAGPLGYQGSKAAMKLISQADVVLALGTRLSIFGTVPQYGMDFFPKNAKIIQVDIDQRQIGLTKPIEVGVIGDARAAAVEILALLRQKQASRQPDSARLDKIQEEKEAWAGELEAKSSSTSTPMSPRRALKELVAALPEDTFVSTDIGNICSVANAYLKFNKPRRFLPALSFGNCGFAYPAALGAKLAMPDSPAVALVGDGAWGLSLAEVMTAVEENLPVVAVVFNNNQWGAEKKNQIDFYDNRFIGTNLQNPDFAAIGKLMGAEGYVVEKPDELSDAAKTALDSGRPAVLNVMVDPAELAEPFRRDALKKPIRYLPRYQQ